MPDDRMEYLVIDGRLDRAGRFTPRRCRSTPNVREWPVVEESEITVELLDAEGAVLHRELARVRPEVDCEPGDTKRFTVLAYIGLGPEAATVRLRRDDLVLWATDIPEAPKLRVAAPRGRPNRRKRLPLALDFSEPHEDAHLTVVYQWGERRFQPVYIGPPSEVIEFDLRDLPGGKECRFVVGYSNGLRSTGDATRTFSLPPVGPSVSIAQPARGTSAIADTPVLLEGHVTDSERPGGPRPDENLTWIVDDEEVGRGPLWSIDGLDAGRHKVTLRYEGADEATAKDSVTLRVVAPTVPSAREWDDWDPTDNELL